MQSETNTTTNLVHKILCHLTKNVRRYFRHSVRIFTNEPQYAGASHRHGDGVRQLGHVTDDLIVCCWLHIQYTVYTINTIPTVPATELDGVNGLLHPACFATVCYNSPFNGPLSRMTWVSRYHSVTKFSDSTAVRSNLSRPHNKYSLQYL